MRRKPSDVLPRYCKSCGKELVRHVHANGKLESLYAIGMRQHCNSRCYGDALQRDNPHPSKPARRKRAQNAIPVDVCVDCGATDGRLCRHHIDRDIANNAPENIAVLCASCHAKRHWAEGEFRKVDWAEVRRRQRKPA